MEEQSVSQEAGQEFAKQRRARFVDAALEILKAKERSQKFLEECDSALAKLDAGEWTQLPQYR